MDQDETDNLLSMTQDGCQPSGPTSKLQVNCCAKLTCDPFNITVDLVSFVYKIPSAELWQLSDANPGENRRGSFGNGVVVADHIKAKSRGGRLPD